MEALALNASYLDVGVSDAEHSAQQDHGQPEQKGHVRPLGVVSRSFNSRDQMALPQNFVI
jgi:hypothetical protein